MIIMDGFHELKALLICSESRISREQKVIWFDGRFAVSSEMASASWYCRSAEFKVLRKAAE